MSMIREYIRLVKRAVANSAYQDESFLNKMGFVCKRQYLEECALNSKDMGVAQHEEDESIIVSLTTYDRRIFSVYRTIESIFQQSYKVSKVVLYLSDKEFDGEEPPLLLQKQMKRGLEIRYVKDIRAYTKLIPALRDFPDSTIITVDDDYMYPVDAVEKLVRAHKKNKKAVCCHASRAILMDTGKKIKPYSTFPQIFPKVCESDISYMAEGFGMVLYPPHCMYKDVTNDELFMELSPLADDLWYKCMQLMAGTPVVQLPRTRAWFSEMYSDESVQDMALANLNVNENKNDPQLKAIFDYYNLYTKLA